jgi:hypothetical protein
MFQPPGTPEMTRVVHEVEIAEATRRARIDREARGDASVRRSIGRMLVAIGTAIGGEHPKTGADQSTAGATSQSPSGPRSATADGGC